jgi:hypothetical protein
MALQEGGCLCADVRYGVQSPPMRVTFCHCRFCQRATGSAYLVEPIFARSDFKLVGGQPAIYKHRSEGSGKIVEIRFCRRCGTKLNLAFERFPDVVGVFAGTFDEPNWFERSPQNSKHIFLAFAQNGTLVPAGVNTFLHHSITHDGAPVSPTTLSAPLMVGSGEGVGRRSAG